VQVRILILGKYIVEIIDGQSVKEEPNYQKANEKEWMAFVSARARQ
jgi:hypothetical protein